MKVSWMRCASTGPAYISMAICRRLFQRAPLLDALPMGAMGQNGWATHASRTARLWRQPRPRIM